MFNVKSGFKGNKKSLPSKPCARCGRPMTWRKAWEKNWEAVRYCSDACRSRRGERPASRSPAGGAG
ncbi:DUF2256 domain-containing protein [Arenimonas aestuarii]